MPRVRCSRCRGLRRAAAASNCSRSRHERGPVPDRELAQVRQHVVRRARSAAQFRQDVVDDAARGSFRSGHGSRRDAGSLMHGLCRCRRVKRYPLRCPCYAFAHEQAPTGRPLATMKLISRLFGKKPPSPPPAPTAGSPAGRAGTARGAARGARATAARHRVGRAGARGAVAPGRRRPDHARAPGGRRGHRRPRATARAAAAPARQGQGGLQAGQAEVRCAAGGRARGREPPRRSPPRCASRSSGTPRGRTTSLYAATLAALATRWSALAAPTSDAERRCSADSRRSSVAARSSLRTQREAGATGRGSRPPSARPRRGTRARARGRAAGQSPGRRRAGRGRCARAGRGRRGTRRRGARPRRAARRRGAGPARDRQPDPPLQRRAAPWRHAQGRPLPRRHRGSAAGRAGAAALPGARSLQQLDERLNELRQWKDYVVAPKRIELIEEMEALVGVDEEPEALAEHIRALQQEWRTINKGIAVDTSAEAERFQQAYQAAFKPCQALLRRRRPPSAASNLEARRQVLARLQAFEAGPRRRAARPPADRAGAARGAAGMAQPLAGRSRRRPRGRGRLPPGAGPPARDPQRLVRTQCRRQAGADRAGAAPVDERGHRRGHRRRQAPAAAVEGHRTGAARAVAGACGKSSAARATPCTSAGSRPTRSTSATLEAAKAQAVALCEKVEQACSVPVAERTAAHTQAREWQAAFDEIGDLPRADARTLRERFERAVGRYEAGVAEQDQRDAAAAESNLFEAGTPRPGLRTRRDAGRTRRTSAQTLRARGREPHRRRAPLAQGRPAGAEAGARARRLRRPARRAPRPANARCACCASAPRS